MVAFQLTAAAGPLRDVPAVSRRAENLGYDAIWMGEVNDRDVAIAATLAASATTRLAVGALMNVYTRAPTNAALTAAGLGHLAGERVAVVLGASSPLLVERWNGIPYRRPFARVKDYLGFLQAALAGERVSGPFETFTTSGFALDGPPATPPRLFVAAAMPRSIRLASEAADGVVLNWLAPPDLERLECLTAPPERVWLSMIVCPTADRQAVDHALRSMMADYLAAPAYAGLQRLVGRQAALQAMWDRFEQGDREGARAQLPASLIDDLVVYGSPEDCGVMLRRIEEAYGIHLIATLFLAEGQSYDDVIGRIAGPGLA